ncbi:ribbon-helix-helix protein, CopG family [Sulfitobacter sp. S223]|nr:ribbon-helix-helix protein, CopG family [Sulfitobacter sp. S223]
MRLLVNTIEAIDAARRSEDDLPSRPEMIRRMIDDWLDRHAEENLKKVE